MGMLDGSAGAEVDGSGAKTGPETGIGAPESVFQLPDNVLEALDGSPHQEGLQRAPPLLASAEVKPFA